MKMKAKGYARGGAPKSTRTTSSNFKQRAKKAS